MPIYIDQQSAPDGSTVLRLKGAWSATTLVAIQREVDALPSASVHALDAAGLETLDTAGAWLIEQLRQKAAPGQKIAPISGLTHDHQAMLDLVNRARYELPPHPERPPLLHVLLIRVGKASVQAWQETLALLRFIGETWATLYQCIRNPRRLRVASIVRHIDETGIDAIPIVALIAFLISVVLAYQGADQLKRFAAEIFTINMVAISVLREMGVLLTAIMVAGRSGSAFTAEIGVMKVNEEVDAMRVIGLNPFEVLVLPRLLALMIAMPILTFIADMMGALGGGIICYSLLDIPPVRYIEQFRASVQMSDFWVGMIKAPVFAFLIAVVGCIRGMEVTGSAESVGRLTTVSVVQSIFLVLLMDALFSVLFSKLGL